MMAMVTVIAGRRDDVQAAAGRGAAARAGACRAGPRVWPRARWRSSRTMPAYPDVPDALAALRAGGFSLARADPVRGRRGRGRARPTRACARRSISCCRPRPRARSSPRTSRTGGRSSSCGASDAWFVAGHWWDIAGASYAGLQTAWISRTDLAYPAAMPAPHVVRPRPRGGHRGNPQSNLKGSDPFIGAFMLEEGAGGEGDVVLEPLGKRGAVAADGGVGNVDDRAGDAVDARGRRCRGRGAGRAGGCCRGPAR